MSSDTEVVEEDDDIEDVAQRMADLQVRRMPVCDGGSRLLGIISLADVVRSKPNKGPSRAADALKGITQPGQQHNP
jgi:CBS-domain-containing membrane protein